MDIGWITNNIGAIIGGFTVIVVAYLLFRPRSNKNQLEKNGKTAVSEEDRKNEIKESESLPLESGSDKEVSPIWKTRRYLLNKIRTMKKPDILSANNREDTRQMIGSDKERLPAVVDIPVLDPAEISLEILQENLETNSMSDIPNEDIPEILLTDTLDDTISTSDEIDKTDIQESTDKDSPDIDVNIVRPPDGTEEINNTQSEVTIMNNEQLSEKPEGGSDVFSLFTDDDEEESETSKFASNLDQVDVNNLLKEAENIQKYLRR